MPTKGLAALVDLKEKLGALGKCLVEPFGDGKQSTMLMPIRSKGRDSGPSEAVPLNDVHREPVDGLDCDSGDVAQTLAHHVRRLVREGNDSDLPRPGHPLTHNVADLLLDDARLTRAGTGTHEHTVIKIDDCMALRVIQSRQGRKRFQSRAETMIVGQPPGPREAATGTP